jgi:hypothetical protein
MISVGILTVEKYFYKPLLEKTWYYLILLTIFLNNMICNGRIALVCAQMEPGLWQASTMYFKV